MILPTLEEMDKLLTEKLASDYHEEYVEGGENWEIIAEIFYKAGFDAAVKKFLLQDDEHQE